MAVENRAVTRAPTLIIAFLSLAVCCAVVSYVGPRSTRNDHQDKPTFPVLSIICKINAPDFKAAQFYARSSYFYILSSNNHLDVYSSDGTHRLSALLNNSETAVLSPDSNYLMTFSPRNPADSKLTFVESSGRTIWEKEVDGAVWCGDALSTKDGVKFVAGTGRGYVYVMEVGPRRKRFRRWRMPGAVVSLAADPCDEGIYVASWQKSALARAGLRGKRDWQVEAEPTALHCVRPLPDSERVLVESIPASASRDGSFEVLDESGHKVFGGTISAAENTRVVPSPNGQFVCCGVNKLIKHKGKSMRENHAILMDDSGKLLWEKGSPFFQAMPIAVTRTGCAIISDGSKAIFLVSPSGEIRQSLRMQWNVLGGVASENGSRLLLKCSGNNVVLLNVAQ